MSTAINTRPTKRVKTNNNPYLPDVAFRNIMSFIVDPYREDKKAHKERFLPIMFQLLVLPFTNGVLQSVIDDNLVNHGWEREQFDIRFQSTNRTRESIEWARGFEDELGQFYSTPKYIKL